MVLKIKHHNLHLDALQSWILYLIQFVAGQNWYKWIVSCPHFELLQFYLHFHVAQVTDNNSNPMTVHCDSVSVKHHDLASINSHVLSRLSCCSTNPQPCLLASMDSHVSLVMSKNASTEALISPLNCLVMLYCPTIHRNLFLVLNNEQKGRLDPGGKRSGHQH